MALVSRISRLFKADFHAVLDQVEEPQALLKQAVRDMEEALCATEGRHRRISATRDALAAQREEMQQVLIDLDEELDLCFDEQEEDLARELIRRKLHTQRTLKQVSARLDAAGKALIAGEKELTDHRAALESARQKAALFGGQPQHESETSSIIDDQSWNRVELCVSKSDVEVAFLREQKRRAQS